MLHQIRSTWKNTHKFGGWSRMEHCNMKWSARFINIEEWIQCWSNNKDGSLQQEVHHVRSRVKRQGWTDQDYCSKANTLTLNKWRSSRQNLKTLTILFSQSKIFTVGMHPCDRGDEGILTDLFKINSLHPKFNIVNMSYKTNSTKWRNSLKEKLVE